MIEIKMEMVPYGYEDGRYQMALIRIVNDATSKNTTEIGHYDVTVFHGHEETKLRIEDFPRRLQIFGLLEEILTKYKEVRRGECQS